MKSQPTYLQLDELIGQGANGRVYSGWRVDSAQTIRQRVAIKILNSKNQVDIWRDEFASLIQINSPRCVRVFGFEWIEGKPALILELVEGVDLSLLASLHQFRESEINYLIGEIYLALEDLHQHGLCHGDLSPANILIDQQGQVRLVDFGFGNSAQGRRQVTPLFAAPEVIQGALPSFLTDLWSLGVVGEYLARGKSSQRIESLLAQLKNERRYFKCDKGREESEKRLAEGVKEYLSRRNRHQTVNMEKAKLGHSIWKVRAGHVAAVVGVAFALVSRGSAIAVESKPSYRLASVQVRSNFGMKVTLDGRPQGYAPLDVLSLPPGQHELVWEGPRGTGRLTLTLRGGQNIVIDDHVLMTR